MTQPVLHHRIRGPPVASGNLGAPIMSENAFVHGTCERCRGQRRGGGRWGGGKMGFSRTREICAYVRASADLGDALSRLAVGLREL